MSADHQEWFRWGCDQSIAVLFGVLLLVVAILAWRRPVAPNGSPSGALERQSPQSTDGRGAVAWLHWGCQAALAVAAIVVAVLAWRCPPPRESYASPGPRDASVPVPDGLVPPSPPQVRDSGEPPPPPERANVRDRILGAGRQCRGSYAVNGTTAIYFGQSGAQTRVWTRFSGEGPDGHSTVLSTSQLPYLADIRSCIERRLSDVTVRPFAGAEELRIGRAW